MGEGRTRVPRDVHPVAARRRPPRVPPLLARRQYLGHARTLITPRFRAVDTPNTETLYSTALLDLADGPIVLVHPDFQGRYYRTSIWELHGDTHTIGERTYGSHPPPLAMVPLGWHGQLPSGVNGIEIRSRYVTVGPHIAVYGGDDLPNVHRLQQGLELYAVAGFANGSELGPGRPMRPARRPGTTTPLELMFLEELCEVLKDLTVRDDELGFARQLRIGVTLSDGFHSLERHARRREHLAAPG